MLRRKQHKRTTFSAQSTVSILVIRSQSFTARYVVDLRSTMSTTSSRRWTYVYVYVRVDQHAGPGLQHGVDSTSRSTSRRSMFRAYEYLTTITYDRLTTSVIMSAVEKQSIRKAICSVETTFICRLAVQFPVQVYTSLSVHDMYFEVHSLVNTLCYRLTVVLYMCIEY